MSKRSVLSTLLLTLALAGPATAECLCPIYQNDFSTRQSLGFIGNLTTFDYSLDNLVGSQNSYTGTQDRWIRRNSGGLEVSVVDPVTMGNPHAQIASGGDFAYAVQPIGARVTEGIVQISVDMLAPTSWQGSSRASYFILGDDDFNSSQTGALGDNPMTFHGQTASSFGFRSANGSNGNVSFVARDGVGDGSSSFTHGVTVTGGNWYRFHANLDLAANAYSVDIFDLGTTAPTLATPTPVSPVQSFADLSFLRSMGDAPVDLNGISTLGIASFGNAQPVGFDNIVISAPRRGYYSFTDVTNLGSAINSSVADVMPRISDDGLRLFFLSDRGATRDVYLATRSHVSEDFAAAARVGGNISQSNFGSSCTFETSDGLHLYFKRDDLYHVATRPDKNTPWDHSTSVTFSTDGLDNLNDAGLMLSDISRDGKTMLGQGMSEWGVRIYVSSWDEVGNEWGEPEMLGINAAGLFPASGDDLQPSFSPDDLTIYFASTRAGTADGGGHDIMALTRPDLSTPWTDYSSLTAHFLEGVNSDSSELGPFMYGNRMYFQSNRAGGFGNHDLYAAIVPEPNTAALLALGIAGLLALFGRRKNRSN